MSVSGDAKSILEVKNIQNAINEMDKIVESGKAIGVEDVLKLHGILMRGLVESEKCGYFRKDDIYVVDDLGDGREKLRYKGPDHTKVPFLINELLSWLIRAKKMDIHPIIKAAILHVEFVTIHPFTDGNGRMARLLTATSLYLDNWDFRKIIVLEDYYNHNRLTYYNALNFVQGDHYHTGEDLTPWIEYFTEGFLVEAKKVKDAISLAGFGKISDKEEQVFLDSDELKIMDFVSTTGKITSADVVKILSIAKRTSQVKIKNLVDKKLLLVKGQGPNTFYILAK